MVPESCPRNPSFLAGRNLRSQTLLHLLTSLFLNRVEAPECEKEKDTEQFLLQ